jgi:hypothetical protein
MVGRALARIVLIRSREKHCDHHAGEYAPEDLSGLEGRGLARRRADFFRFVFTSGPLSSIRLASDADRSAAGSIVVRSDGRTRGNGTAQRSGLFAYE